MKSFYGMGESSSWPLRRYCCRHCCRVFNVVVLAVVWATRWEKVTISWTTFILYKKNHHRQFPKDRKKAKRWWISLKPLILNSCSDIRHDSLMTEKEYFYVNWQFLIGCFSTNTTHTQFTHTTIIMILKKDGGRKTVKASLRLGICLCHAKVET